MSPKKKAATAKPTKVAQATSGSVARRRKCQATTTRYPARIRVHSNSEPWSADHIPVMRNSSGVPSPSFWATYAREKSRVTRACSIAPAAPAAASRTSQG